MDVLTPIPELIHHIPAGIDHADHILLPDGAEEVVITTTVDDYRETQAEKARPAALYEKVQYRDEELTCIYIKHIYKDYAKAFSIMSPPGVKTIHLASPRIFLYNGVPVSGLNMMILDENTSEATLLNIIQDLVVRKQFFLISANTPERFEFIELVLRKNQLTHLRIDIVPHDYEVL